MATFRVVDAEKSVLKLVGTNYEDGQIVLLYRAHSFLCIFNSGGSQRCCGEPGDVRGVQCRSDGEAVEIGEKQQDASRYVIASAQ